MNLCVDTIKYICYFLSGDCYSNRNINNFLSTNKYYYAVKHLIKFTGPVSMSKNYLANLSYYDSFTNLIYDTDKLYTSFPKNITKLLYDIPTIGLSIPNTVDDLSFGYEVDDSIFDNVPHSVIELKFYKFNRSLSGVIPPNVKVLILSDDFNQPISSGMLPDSIEELWFGENFNRSINNGAIPKNVKKLNFGHYFNQKIIGNIPNGVKDLSFGPEFAKQISGAIPDSIEKLWFGNLLFDQPILGKIPQNLKRLILPKRYPPDLLIGVTAQNIIFLP